LDIELNQHGISQAKATAEQCAGLDIDAIYASDLKRALQTAQEIARPIGMQIICDPRLREMNMGIFEGMLIEKIKTDYAEIFGLYASDNPEYIVPNGESRQQKHQRVVSFIEETLPKHVEKTIIVVSHGGVFYDFFHYAFQIPLSRRIKLRHENCSISTFYIQDGKWTLCNWNNTSHLL
jgi:2,3-bisphosphoglycerate-dependent phosphoglycerate mutase